MLSLLHLCNTLSFGLLSAFLPWIASCQKSPYGLTSCFSSSGANVMWSATTRRLPLVRMHCFTPGIHGNMMNFSMSTENAGDESSKWSFASLTYASRVILTSSRWIFVSLQILLSWLHSFSLSSFWWLS